MLPQRADSIAAGEAGGASDDDASYNHPDAGGAGFTVRSDRIHSTNTI